MILYFVFGVLSVGFVVAFCFFLKVRKNAEILSADLNAAKFELNSAQNELKSIQKDFEFKQKELNISQNEILKLQKEQDSLRADLLNTKAAQSRAEAILSEKTEYYENILKQKEMQFLAQKEEQDLRFKEYSQKLIAEQKTALNTDSRRILDEVFAPLKKQIDEYRVGLSKNEAFFSANLERLFTQSASLKSSADNLVAVLKGSKKLRGNFGELRLKSVLENAGLIEGEQFSLQESFEASAEFAELKSKRFLPDALVNLSDGRRVVIDSKFVLPDCAFLGDNLAQNQLNLNSQNSANIAQNENLSLNLAQDSIKNDNDECFISPEIAANIAKNLKARIDELAKKPYAQISDAAPFVLLFLPYERLLDLALSAQSDIYAYARAKDIYLTTPNTLFLALSTISLLWQQKRQSENVEMAFEKIAKFYDKFAAAQENADEMLKVLRKAINSADEFYKQLYTGKGCLAIQFEQLKELGAKTKKSLKIANDLDGLITK